MHFHPAGAALGDAQAHRSGVTEINHPAVVERATVIDAHDHRLAIVQVGHPRKAGQRQGLVRGGEGVHVVDLSVGGQPAVEFLSVIRSSALLDVAVDAVHHLVLLAQHRIRRLVAHRRARFIGHQRLGDAIHVRHVVGRGVVDPGLVQATCGVVATRGQVFLRLRIGRALRAFTTSAAMPLHHRRRPRRCTAAVGRCGFLGSAAAGGQPEHDQRRDQPLDVHAGGSSLPAMAWDSWNTAIAYILEML